MTLLQDPKSFSLERAWTPYVIRSAPLDLLCRFWNESNGQQWTGYARDIHPLSNVAYLWWMLTGIAKETMRKQAKTEPVKLP